VTRATSSDARLGGWVDVVIQAAAFRLFKSPLKNVVSFGNLLTTREHSKIFSIYRYR